MDWQLNVSKHPRLPEGKFVCNGFVKGAIIKAQRVRDTFLPKQQRVVRDMCGHSNLQFKVRSDIEVVELMCGGVFGSDLGGRSAKVSIVADKPSIVHRSGRGGGGGGTIVVEAMLDWSG